MNKNYLIIFIALIVFFIVVFSFSKLTEVKSNLNDSVNNYEYHIIYYDYDKTTTNENTNTEEAEDEDFGDYYDDPVEGEEDIENDAKAEIYLPIHIYKKGNKVNVSKEYQPTCSNPPCEVKTMDYEIKFSKEKQDIINNYIINRFNGSNEKEITLYKNDLSKRETIIINSLLNNEESYLN